MFDKYLERWESRWLEPPCEEYEKDTINEGYEEDNYDTDIEI